MFLKLLWQRWQSESPQFFKKIMTFAIVLGVILTGYKMLIQFEIIPHEGIWLKLSNLFNFVLGGLGGMVFTSGAATNDPNLMDVKTKENIVETAIENPEVISAEPPADKTIEDNKSI